MCFIFSATSLWGEGSVSFFSAPRNFWEDFLELVLSIHLKNISQICITWDLQNPANSSINYQLAGGFLPSTGTSHQRKLHFPMFFCEEVIVLGHVQVLLMKSWAF